MKGLPGILAAIVATLAVALPAHGAEQTKETYKERIEPVCKANRIANERIMSGARQRIKRKMWVPVGRQFVRVSGSFGKLIKRLGPVPPPVGYERTVQRWVKFMRLVKLRLFKVGKLYKAGEDIKAAHMSILAERAGISANNISIVFRLRECRFSRIG
ncbi:MAG TPA: hypothetical protein VFT19_04900 [Solirubrobacterales bacterium]|nr:hypothetical protein [Solirubrobacterales bacterium]